MSETAASLPADQEAAAGREQIFDFLMSVRTLAAAVESDPCFSSGGLSFDEWSAMAMMQRPDGIAKLGKLDKALGISRKRSRELVGKLTAERLLEAQAAEDGTSKLTLTEAGLKRWNAVSDSLFDRIGRVTGPNPRKFIRSPKAMRLLTRELSKGAETDPA